MHNPLAGWLDRRHPIPRRFYESGHIDTPSPDWHAWLSIEESAPLHKVNDMQWLSLRDARLLTNKYLEGASEIVRGIDGGWLDRWEQEEIRANLGEAPKPSLPIYLISCGDGKDESLVYVGKTKNTPRFTGGHATALKLHAPEYDGELKNIYRCTPWFHFNDEYISLDWIQPEEIALQLLDSIESQLIYWLKPPLNTDKKKKNLAKWEFRIHIQNLRCGEFLNDRFI